MACAKAGCYKKVGYNGLGGYCAEHKTEAVMQGVEVALERLDEQKTQIEEIDRQLRALSQQLQR